MGVFSTYLVTWLLLFAVGSATVTISTYINSKLSSLIFLINTYMCIFDSPQFPHNDSRFQYMGRVSVDTTQALYAWYVTISHHTSSIGPHPFHSPSHSSLVTLHKASHHIILYTHRCYHNTYHTTPIIPESSLSSLTSSTSPTSLTPYKQAWRDSNCSGVWDDYCISCVC